MNYSKHIKYNKGIADFVSTFMVLCPNYPKEPHNITQFDVLKMNFCRYSKRSMYYAENFMEKLEKLEEKLKESHKDSQGKIIISIPDDIFFDFDAFIFSCKSILEGNIIKRAEYMHPIVLPQFKKYSQDTFTGFIKSYLNPLRDEVVHINNHGSAMGSIVSMENGEIHIPAFNYKKETELKTVFITVLNKMSEILKTVASFILLHECYTFGYPEKDIPLYAEGNYYSLSDFIRR